MINQLLKLLRNNNLLKKKLKKKKLKWSKLKSMKKKTNVKKAILMFVGQGKSNVLLLLKFAMIKKVTATL